MKRKIIYLTFILAALLAFVCSGCTGFKLIRTDDFDIGYNKYNKKSFIAACYWSGGEKVIEIPDEYNGSKITALGGYYGRGVPCPFRIVLQNYDFDWVGSNSDEEDDDECETLVFTVKIGKNITKLQYVSGKDFYGIHTESDDVLLSDALYKVVYYFEVDEENNYLYSVDGRLYYKQNNQLIDEFFYE